MRARYTIRILSRSASENQVEIYTGKKISSVNLAVYVCLSPGEAVASQTAPGLEFI
jgi:hypothetical protein